MPSIPTLRPCAGLATVGPLLGSNVRTGSVSPKPTTSGAAYGMFALDERGSDLVAGFCGLIHPGGQPEPEIKYAVMRSRWGHGLASEAVSALLNYGSTCHSLSRIIATVASGNLASQRVVVKAGMRFVQARQDEDGSVTQVYEWHASSAG
jgi:ribosomal-protein-alanine N-acetyltransferase